MVSVSVLLVIAGFVYIVFLKPKFEKERDVLIFDNRAIGYLEGLHYGDIELGCSVSDLRFYLEMQLSKAHALPGNQSLIDYTAANGYRYSSHLGPEDYKLFVLLCIAQRANDRGNYRLVDWCESKFEEARRIRF